MLDFTGEGSLVHRLSFPALPQILSKSSMCFTEKSGPTEEERLQSVSDVFP